MLVTLWQYIVEVPNSNLGYPKIFLSFLLLLHENTALMYKSAHDLFLPNFFPVHHSLIPVTDAIVRGTSCVINYKKGAVRFVDSVWVHLT